MTIFNDKPISLEYREYPLDNSFPLYALFNGGFCVQPKPITNLTFLHFHNCVEIGIVKKGTIRLYVESQNININQGDVFFLAPYTMHISHPATLQNEGQCEYLYMLPDILLNDFFPNHIPDILLPYHFKNFPIHFPLSEYPEVASLVSRLFDTMREKRTNYIINAKGLVLTLMTELSRSLPEGPKDVTGNEILPLLLPALRYIDQYYSSEISIDLLAKLCHISTSHFHKLFKQSLNLSPVQYIQHIRLTHACILLHSTELSVLSIALSVGFSSVSNFNKQFQKWFHQTPRQWRNDKRDIQKKNLRHSVFPIK